MTDAKTKWFKINILAHNSLHTRVQLLGPSKNEKLPYDRTMPKTNYLRFLNMYTFLKSWFFQRKVLLKGLQAKKKYHYPYCLEWIKK